MSIHDLAPMSRCHFVVSAAVVGAAAWLALSRLLGEEPTIAEEQVTVVEEFRRAAATNPMSAQDMLVAVRDGVAALKRQGRAVADVVAAKPTAQFDATWGGSLVDPGFFTRLVYKGV